MPRFTWICPGLLAMAALIASPSSATVLRLTNGAGRAGYSLEQSWRGNGHPSSSSTYMREWVAVPFSGEILHTRIINYRGVISPKYSQQADSELPRSIDSREVDLSAGVHLLQGQPLSLHADWSRASGSASGGFGTSSNFHNSGFTSALNLGNRMMPLNLRYASRENTTTSRVGRELIPLEQSYRVRTLRFSGRNGKLSFDVGKYNFEDRIGTSDYSTSDVNVNHYMRWGKGSSHEASFSRVEHDNTTHYVRKSWRQRLIIKHTQSTKSGYSFQRSQSANGNGGYTNSTHTGRIDSKIRSWASVGISGTARKSELEHASQDIYDIAPSASLNLKLPGAARVTGDVSVGYQRKVKRGDGGSLWVINQREHFDPAGSILIVRPGIDAASIRVRNSDETIIFEEGLDYRVIESGNVVEIRVLAGGRIAPDETVLVSYHFEQRLDGREEAMLTRYSFTLSFDGLSLRHARSKRGVESSDAQVFGVLSEMEQGTTSITALKNTAAGDLRLNLFRRDRKSVTLDYVTYEAGAEYSVVLTSRLMVHMDVTGRNTREGGTHVTSWFSGPSFSWTLGNSLNLRGGTRYQRWKRTGDIGEVTWSGDLDVGWRVASTETRTRLAYERREYSETSTGARLSVYVVRRF